ncbi:M16 family metallopeptidase [Acidobacteriota bacterium]
MNRQSAYRTCLIVTILILISTSALASQEENLRVVRLENGMTVVLKEDHTRPVIAVSTFFNGGGRTESDDLKGLSHYYEHIVFRGGTKQQEELETRKTFRKLGEFSGFTTNDYTAYYMVTPVENFDEAFWRYTDALMEVEVTEEKVEKDRQSVIQEFHMRINDNPSGKAWYRIWQTAFKKHPYRITTIGSEDVIRDSKVGRFRTFYEERYVPNQMFMSVVGDFEPVAVLQAIKHRFNEYRRGRESFELGVREPEQTKYRESIEQMPSELSYIHIGFKIPSALHQDYPACELLSEILSGGRGSRLQKALKVSEEIALSVWTWPEARIDPSLFLIGITAEPGMEERAIRTTLEELWRLTAEEMPGEELERAKFRHASEQRFRHESFERQAMDLCWYALMGDPTRRGLQNQIIRNSKPQEIKRVAREIFNASRCSLVVVRPQGQELKKSYEDLVARILPKKPPRKRALKGEKPTGQLQTEVPPGLKLLVNRGGAEGVTSVVALVRGGTRSEPEGQEGITSMVTRLLPRGAGDMTADDLADRFDALGFRLGRQSSHDYSEITLMCPSESLREALDLILLMLFKPRFDQDQISTIRSEMLAELESIKDSSFDATDDVFMGKIFHKTPYGRLVIGSEESLKAIDAEMLKKHHAAFFKPSNVILSVAGDAASEAVRARVVNLMDAYQDLDGAAPELPVPLAVKEPVKGKKKKERRIKEISVEREARQVTFDMGSFAVPVTHKDHLPLVLVRSILGNRLFFRYVYEEGMAYRMWTLYPNRIGSTPFYFQMGVAPENFETAKNGILESIREFLDGDLPEEEIELAKESLIQSHRLAQQRSLERARMASLYELWGFGLSYFDEYEEKLRAIPPEIIKETARVYLRPDQFILVKLGPAVPGTQDTVENNEE